MPMYVIMQSKLAKMYPLRNRPIQHPTTELVLGNVDRRHRPYEDVVQVDRNRGCDLIATANPGYTDREQRL